MINHEGSLLWVEGLTTGYWGPWDLRVDPGELIQVTGASGSGKSLLLRALVDLDPSMGEVFLEGEERATFSPAGWRLRVGYVPAETAWWESRVHEHFSDGWSLELARQWLQDFSLPEESLDWSVERLSSGEKQRLGLLRTLLNRPRLLLLDEPTANLDMENTRRIERAIRNYVADEQAGAIWVSHDLLQRGRLGGRVLEICNGKLLE